MNILKALCWRIQAWNINIVSVTIQHCFQRVLFKKTDVLSEDLLIIQISNDFQWLCMISGIQNLMKIENFLNSAEEVVEDSSEDLERHIIEQLEPEDEKEKETINLEADLQISTTEALDMVKRLGLYEEWQDKGDTELIQQLNHYERRLGARRLENQQHQDIRTYFRHYCNNNGTISLNNSELMFEPPDLVNILSDSVDIKSLLNWIIYQHDMKLDQRWDAFTRGHANFRDPIQFRH
ncbi:hypothetical protein CIRG_05778 [Coccidioides immitis RMSCC 2394]|uniref:Uncharacterized protein n=1 Tax=Coccidioides immitis RMSCC 2394 TaxID=404692 RepID=A0A0J7B808_COCIT|nr:hypothetical protein CIRG_05778 [Coccidioides immitis RMSCC 2394]